MKLRGTFGCLFLVLWAEVALSQPTNLSQFPAALRALKQDKTRVLTSSDETGITKMGVLKVYDADFAALLALSLAGESEFLELMWWEKDNPETRAFIVALFWCQQPPPARQQDPWPFVIVNFQAKADRFAPAEREQRLRECDLVVKHLSHIARELAEVVERYPSQRAREIAKRYRKIAETRRGEMLSGSKN